MLTKYISPAITLSWLFSEDSSSVTNALLTGSTGLQN